MGSVNKYYFSYRYVDIMTEIAALFSNVNINETECAPSDIKRVLRWISTSQSDNAMKLITRFMHMGASLYTVGIHLTVLRFASRNTKIWKKKALSCKPEDKSFLKWAKSRQSSVKDLVPIMHNAMRRKKKGKTTVTFSDSDDEVLTH